MYQGPITRKTLQFYVDELNLYKNRNRRHVPCVEDIQNHDEKLMQAIIKRIGCRPPYIDQKVAPNAPCCKEKEKLDELLTILSLGNSPIEFSPYYTSPCYDASYYFSKEILDIRNDKEVDGNNKNKLNNISFHIHMDIR